jgi:flagellar hook-associated protein 1 FlgK
VGGELGALVDVLNVDIPATGARLDELAAGIVSAVNTAHRAGWSPARDTDPVEPPGWSGSGVDFFDPAHTDAATISLSAEVRGDRDMIAAGAVYAGPGDNGVARAMARLRESAVTWGSPATTAVLGAHYRDTVSVLATSASAAASSATVFETLAASTDARRQSVAGVSTDEELIALMRHQQAYTAATRLVTVADEMAQAILNMV